jgi:hypothetical protein
VDTGAIIMLLIGGIGLWGTLAVAVWNYMRRSRSEVPDGTGEAR